MNLDNSLARGGGVGVGGWESGGVGGWARLVDLHRQGDPTPKEGVLRTWEYVDFFGKLFMN